MIGNPDVNARDIVTYFQTNVSILILRNKQDKPLAMGNPFISDKPTSFQHSRSILAKFVEEFKCILLIDKTLRA